MRETGFLFLQFLFLLSCNESVKSPVAASDIKDSPIINRSENIVNPNSNLDLSPMDMIYFPEDYPIQKMTKHISEPPIARVIYSRPRIQGRKVFGELLKYDSPWRLGANESTEIDLFRDVYIEGNKVPAGRYILYCIPKEKSWTIVFNKNIDSWGLRMDQSMDIFRFVIPIIETNYQEEYFTMRFEAKDKGMNLLISWDHTTARLPINYQ